MFDILIDLLAILIGLWFDFFDFRLDPFRMPVVHDGGGSSKDDDGRGPGNYLEKITPKDLVMFSSSTRKQIAKVIFNEILKLS